ncbi:hypothetical protein DM52_951 [Burkholderia mallei]|nr:hypothetical protein BM47_3341 [Burkholderia mallei]KOT20647.1 hypothetical protein DM52_951 [Burkholderia mallei]
MRRGSTKGSANSRPSHGSTRGLKAMPKTRSKAAPDVAPETAPHDETPRPALTAGLGATASTAKHASSRRFASWGFEPRRAT